jgi:hypothetical protein
MAYPGIEKSGSLGHRTTNLAQRLEGRLAILKDEYDMGQACLYQVDAELTLLRETMLRISVAILVLQEILSPRHQQRLQFHLRMQRLLQVRNPCL